MSRYQNSNAEPRPPPCGRRALPLADRFRQLLRLLAGYAPPFPPPFSCVSPHSSAEIPQVPPARTPPSTARRPASRSSHERMHARCEGSLTLFLPQALSLLRSRSLATLNSCQVACRALCRPCPIPALASGLCRLTGEVLHSMSPFVITSLFSGTHLSALCDAACFDVLSSAAT